MKLVVGYIPEHFSCPLFFAKEKGFFEEFQVDVELRPFPSGSGHLIQCLTEGSIDVSIGLTEAHIKSIALGSKAFQLLGVYVNSPLCWAVSTGAKRDEIKELSDIQGKIIGISRYGSGSEVMAHVLEKQQSWEANPFTFVVNNDFKNLRDGVNLTGTAHRSDAFMWEHFTSKKYYDNGEIKRIGEIFTPWPSWVICASPKAVKEKHAIRGFLKALTRGIQYFQEHHSEAVDWISSNLDYSADDARSWIQTVEFSQDITHVPKEVVKTTLNILAAATDLPDDAASLDYVATLN